MASLPSIICRYSSEKSLAACFSVPFGVALQIGISATTTAARVAMAATASQVISLKRMLIQFWPAIAMLFVARLRAEKLQLDGKQMPACYSAVLIEYKESSLSVVVKNWYANHETGAEQLVDACDPNCSKVSKRCQEKK
jgi:hypothetical protein